MAWSKEWVADFDKAADEAMSKAGPVPWARSEYSGIDFGSNDKTVTAVITDNGEMLGNVLEKVYDNNIPTHNPYTNPNSHIYYQCNCGEILDPKTKSFAALNNAAMNNGWKIRWGDASYVPYCVKCGKDIE